MIETQDVTAFLCRPESYGLTSDVAVERVETHAACVFLSDSEAWKIKKPVNLGFLDFSTLEKRRAALARELEVNRRWAGDLYKDLCAITREADGSLTIGGAGAVVEWALRMRRFQAEQLLSRIAATDGLDDHTAETLGAAVAAMHADASRATGDGVGGALAHVAANETGLRARAAILGEGAVDDLLTATKAEIAAQEPLLRARAAAGFTRRCHGDLHLNNIIWEEGRAVPFDALEFDESLAETDTLLDLAFLLMDCAHAGQTRAANRVLNAYLEAAADRPVAAMKGLAALPLFLCCRATTRAHVAAASGQAEEARHYLAEARARLHERRGRLIAIGGRSGTGKSTLARALAVEISEPPGPVIIRSDAVRKRLAGVSAATRLGPQHYSAEAHARVWTEMVALARAGVIAGGDVMLDATFLDPEWRAAAKRLAADADVPFHGLWLDAPEDVLTARVTARRADVSDADAAVVARQMASDEGEMSWARVDVSGTPEDALVKARAIVGSA